MFAVIPTRVQAANPCLPYALASITRYTDLTPVTVGHDTGLVDHHIPTRQGPDAFANTRTALEAALGTDWIGDRFVWSHDDIYWLRPAPVVRYAIGDLRRPPAASGQRYRSRKIRTAAWLDDRGYPVFDYEAHVPLVISKEGISSLWGDNLPQDVEWRSAYLNVTGEPDVIGPDVKMRNIDAPVPDAPWVSTSGDPMRYRRLAPVLR